MNCACLQAQEPLSALFHPGTGTRTLFFNYTAELVKRYSTDPTVLFWEVCSE